MKEYDKVKLIVEKEIYANQGARKGMEGVIVDSSRIDKCWLVLFFGDDNIKVDGLSITKDFDVSVNEEDLEVIE